MLLVARFAELGVIERHLWVGPKSQPRGDLFGENAVIGR